VGGFKVEGKYRRENNKKVGRKKKKDNAKTHKQRQWRAGVWGHRGRGKIGKEEGKKSSERVTIEETGMMVEACDCQGRTKGKKKTQMRKGGRGRGWGRGKGTDNVVWGTGGDRKLGKNARCFKKKRV